MTQPLFGVDLVELARSNRNLREGLPVVVFQCIHYLYDGQLGVEGILRIPGDRTLINEFKATYDAGQPVYLNRARDPFTIASLLKMYLHDLPEPLLTKALHQKLLDTQLVPDKTDDERVAAVAALLKQIPDINKAILWNVMALAHAIADRSEENKMNIENIAVCLGPTLMWNSDVTDPSEIVREMMPINGIMKILINHPEVIPDTRFKIDPPAPPKKKPTTEDTVVSTTSSSVAIPPPQEEPQTGLSPKPTSAPPKPELAPKPTSEPPKPADDKSEVGPKPEVDAPKPTSEPPKPAEDKSEIGPKPEADAPKPAAAEAPATEAK